METTTKRETINHNKDQICEDRTAKLEEALTVTTHLVATISTL